jgi:hypothetical protein
MMATHQQQLAGLARQRFSGGEVSKAADWELCITLLRTKAPVVQQRAAKHLRQYVETAVREMSTDAFARFEGELYQRIFALVRGSDMTERLGGVAALDELIDASSTAAETKIIKFSNNLSNALRVNTDHTVLVQVRRHCFFHVFQCDPLCSDACINNTQHNRCEQPASAGPWLLTLANADWH